MTFKETLPCIPLRPYINCFWYYDEAKEEFLICLILGIREFSKMIHILW